MKSKKTQKNKLKISPNDLKKISKEANSKLNCDGRIVLEGKDAKTLVACLNSFEVILEMLSKDRMRIDSIRKLLGIETFKPEIDHNKDNEDQNKKDNDTSGSAKESEEAPDNCGSDKEEVKTVTVDETKTVNEDETTVTEDEREEQSDPASSSSNESAEASGSPDPDLTKGSRSRHGPNHADDFSNGTKVDCNVPGLHLGDHCPLPDCSGKLYSHQPKDAPRQLVVFDAQPFIEPTIYCLNDLHCNSCKGFYKADLPAELGEQGVERGSGRQYTNRFTAFLLVAHYYFGRSFRSMEQLNGMMGFNVADSTLNAKALELKKYLSLLCERSLKMASDCQVLYGDDIGSKVNSILPEIRPSRSGVETYRCGIYTSIVVGITDEGRPIPIFSTGLHHLGETLDKILSKRAPNLGKPVIVRDQSSSNKVTVCETLSAGCLQHARDNFLDAEKNYPEESEEILGKISKIFDIDRQTQNLLPEERLHELNKNALPIMESLYTSVESLIESKIATPSSDMGVALRYFKNHYSSLLLPYKIAGIGLTNNLSEWMTYPVVRYINNCRHYGTEDGAEIGDYVTSLTMLALLSDRNPIKYFEFLLANKDYFEKCPSANFLPWDIPFDKVPKLSKNWFTNWIPQPGNAECRQKIA